MKRLGLLLACCLVTTSANAKAPMTYSIKTPGQHQALKDHALYEVKVTCSRGQSLSSDNNILDAIADFILHRNESANQYVVIGNDLAVADPSDAKKIKLPEKAIAVLPVFSIKDTSVVSNFDACSRSIYVQGTQKIFLIPTVSWSSQYTSGPGLTALYQASKLISPLWSIFNPAAIPAAIASKITNAQATENPIKEILTTMNKDANYGETIRLKTGRYIITTKYSKVTLDVSPLPSIVMAASDDLRRDFRAALDSATQKIATTGFEATCGQIATVLTGAGFSEKEDIPYALTYLSANALNTKDDMIKCLGRPYAAPAARLSGPILWQWINLTKRFTVDEANTVWPPNGAEPRLQPAFSTIEDTIDALVRSLSRVTKNRDGQGNAIPQYVNELKATVTPTVSVEDKTLAALFNSLPPQDASALGETLLNKGYARFGCYAEITDKFGTNTDGARVLFVMFKIAKDAPSPTTLDTAAGVRVLFGTGGLVSQLVVTDRLTAIRAALDANTWNCNGLAVTKPPAS